MTASYSDWLCELVVPAQSFYLLGYSAFLSGLQYFGAAKFQFAVVVSTRLSSAFWFLFGLLHVAAIARVLKQGLGPLWSQQFGRREMVFCVLSGCLHRRAAG